MVHDTWSRNFAKRSFLAGAQGLVARRILYDDHGPTFFPGTEQTSHRARTIGAVPDQNDQRAFAAKKRAVADKLNPPSN